MATRYNGNQRRRVPEDMRNQDQVRRLGRNNFRSQGSYRSVQGYGAYEAPGRRPDSRNPRQQQRTANPRSQHRPPQQERRQAAKAASAPVTKPASAPKQTASSRPGAGAVAVAVLGSIGSALKRTYLTLWAKSKVAALAVIVVLLVLVLWLVSLVMPHDRIADGVHVGELDVSGMTVPEASAAIGDKYLPHLNATTVYVFADEETANSADIELQMIENEAQAEQLSFEEAQSNKKLWVASAESLNATLPSDDLAREALELGNSMDFFQKLAASADDLNVTPRATYDEAMLSSLIEDINLALGSPVENYDLDIEDGDITVTEGEDGYLLDNAEFESQLNDVLLVDAASLRSFVADIKDTPYVIDEAMANSTMDAIRASIPESVEFTSDEKTVTFDRDTLMGWVATKPTEVDGRWYLEPYLDRTTASKDVLEAVNVHNLSEDITITFEVDDDEGVKVTSSEDVALPNIDGALETLDNQLFDAYRTTGEAAPADEDISIGITMSDGKSQFALDEALSYGLVTEFSSYTTQYTTSSSTLNRRDNIHLVADTLDNTVARADGGEWSFLDHSGPMEEEDGYKEAGVIVSGKMDQGVGGGVCQVATTVFNAVYEAGLQIDERHNHTLYTSSYPAGLDAAVSYPSLDLIWTNQTSSDILLVTSYTDTSVTITLIGIDPELEVVTETGEWEDGKKHITEYEIAENLKPDASYVKTAPTDGRKISVTRFIKDKDGSTIDWDYFGSIYSPVNRVIAYGEGSDMAKLREKYAEEDDD